MASLMVDSESPHCPTARARPYLFSMAKVLEAMSAHLRQLIHSTSFTKIALFSSLGPGSIQANHISTDVVDLAITDHYCVHQTFGLQNELSIHFH